MHNRTVRIALALLFVLAAGGAGAYIALRAGLVGAPPNGAADATPSTTGTYTEHSAYADIDAIFATSTPLRQTAGAEADAKAAARMRTFVEQTIAQFRTDGDFANLTPSDAETLGLGAERRYDLQIHYLSASGPRSVSYIYQIDTYTLGAHGNTTYRTFTFDLASGTELALPDIFVPNAPYAEKLSTLSRKLLPALVGEYLDTDMVKDGTAAESRNFEAFFLDGASLVIIFPPYAVAPYAAGPQTLAIPVAQLLDILKPEYQ